jgi:hypothetical protein
MELLRGIASEVRIAAADATDTEGTASLQMAGRAVVVAVASAKCPIHDGDEIIAAGCAQGTALAALAYYNVSRGCVNKTPYDIAPRGLALSLAIVVLWAGSTADDWTVRAACIGAGSVLVILTAVSLLSLVRNLRAEFRVRSAALQAVRGIARNVARSADGDAAPAEPTTLVEVAGRIVEFPAGCAIRDGDEVVVVGAPVGPVLAAMACHNITRSAPSVTVAGIAPAVAIFSVFAIVLVAAWSGFGMTDFALLVTRFIVLWLALGLGYQAFDRLFRWQLSRQAQRQLRRG